MVTKTYRLSFDLLVKIDDGDTVTGALPLEKHVKHHIKTFIQTFAQDDAEILEFYKRYVGDLFGSDIDLVDREIAKHLPAKNEKENYLAVAAMCPHDTELYIKDLLETDDAEIAAMPREQGAAFTQIQEMFHDSVLKSFHPPRITKASLREMTGREKLELL